MGSLQPIFIDTSYHELLGSFCCALSPLLLAPLWCPNLQTGNLGSAVEMLLQSVLWLCRKRLQHSMRWNLWNLWHNLFLHLQPSDQRLLLSNNGSCYNNNSRSYDNNNRCYNNNDCSNDNNHRCSNKNNRANNNNCSSLYCNWQSLPEHY